MYWEPWGDFDKVLLHPVFAKSNESLLSPVYDFFIYESSELEVCTVRRRNNFCQEKNKKKSMCKNHEKVNDSCGV